MARTPLKPERRGWEARARHFGNRIGPYLPALRVAAFTAAVGIVVFMCVQAAKEVDFGQLTWWPLPLALAATVIWWLLLAYGWAVLASGGFTKHDVATWTRTQTLRYLPGGVWAPASRATVLHGGWVDRITTVAAENVIALCAALGIGGLALGASNGLRWLPLVLAVAAPAVASRFVSEHTRLAPDRVHRAVLNYLAAFAAYVVAAVLVQGAVSGFTHSLEVAGAAAVAWGVGLVVIFAPGGVGVRELVYVAILAHAFPDGDLAAGAVTLRGITIVAELGVLVVAGRPQGSERTARRAWGAVSAWVRGNALFTGLLGAGVALRALAYLAYSPGIVYYDSVDYLHRASHLAPGQARPLGYSIFLRLMPGDPLWAAPLAQHLLGLGVGVIVYLLLTRLGVRRWAAALAAAPMLLDAYQLVMEEYILSETLFAFLLVAACAALLWRRRPGPMEAAIAGALLAGAALTRANGLLVFGPALLAVVFLYWRPRPRIAEGLRSAVPALVALVLAFAVPVAAYATWFHGRHGSFAVTDAEGTFLYGRVSTFVDCSKFSVPDDQRVLCPTQAVGHRPRLKGSTVNWYTWANYGDNQSPRFRLPDVPGRGSLPRRFAQRAILHQPGDYFSTVSHDFLRGFAPIRTRHHDELPISRWQFSEDYPAYSRRTEAMLARYGDAPGTSRTGLTRFLRGYQRLVFTWGPVLVLGALAGLLAALGIGRARRSGLRTAAFLFTTLPLLLFGTTVAVNTFTWRYQLILVVLLPPAAVLGLTAILRQPADIGDSPEVTP